jgi:TRAP-type uncharacterized transport system substrate-binding protein
MKMLIATLMVATMAAAAWAQSLPKAVTIGSNPPGAGYYAVASGLAKVVSQGTGMQMAVQPHSGTSTMLPLLHTGEMDFGTINAVDVGLAYRGPGYYGRVVEDTCFVAYDTYLVTSKAVPDDVVEAVVKAIWDRVEELHPVHPLLKERTRDRFVDPEPTLPYHPGAIRYYKEKGVWSAAMDQVQQKALNP